jgi:hypothetical protein
LEDDQVTAAEAPLTVVTVAARVTCPPIRMTGAAGVTTTEETEGGGGTMVATIVADLVGSNTEVAVIFVVPTETPVTVPVTLTVAAATLDDVQVTLVDAPPTAETTAVSNCVAPTATVALVGVMATTLMAGRGLTVTNDDALFRPSKVDVAVMVADPTVTPDTCPVAETVAAAAFEVDQVTAVDAPLTTATAAVSWI